MNNKELFQKILMIIPYIYNRGSSVSEDELKHLFRLNRKSLRKIYAMTLLLGYPPYTPDNFFDLYIDENDPKKVTLWVPRQGLLTKPVSFTVKEAFALISGYHLVSRTLQIAKLQELIDKMKQSLKKTLLFGNDNTDEKVEFSIPSTHCIEKYIQIVEKAVEHHCILKMDYYAASRDVITSRMIAPYLTVNHFGRWYIAGWCLEKNEYRVFRLDRIKSLKMKEERFTPRADFDKAKYLKADYFYFGTNGSSETLVLRFRKKAVKTVKQDFFNAEIRELPSGDIIAEMPMQDHAWILSRIRKYGYDVVVVSPEDLKKKLISGYENLLKLYDV